MRVLGLAGWSGSGKTTLLARLLPLLAARGLRISTLKHAHHAVDLDVPGKDSWRHREAGAFEVMLATGRRFALMRELRDAPEPSLPELLARMTPVDLVLVEGFRHGAFPKIEVHDTRLGKPLIAADDPFVRAVATEDPGALAGHGGLGGRPVLDRNDISAIAELALRVAEDRAGDANVPDRL